MNIKLIGNGTVITDLFGGALIEDGAVAFDGGKIIAVGKKDDIRRDHSVKQFIDARGGYIMPGLIDAHLHITSPIISSLTVNDSGSLPLWFSYSSNEKQLLKKIDLNTCRALALASAKDCIQNGITSAFVLHSSPNCIKGSLFEISSAFREVGLRCSIGYETDESFGPNKLLSAVEENDAFSEYASALNSRMLVSSFGVGEITKQSRSALYGFYSSGIDRTYQIHTNCSEFDATAYALKNRETPIETLRSCSLLNSDTLLAGCSYMTARELDMFAESGAAAVLTPVSNAEAGKESIPMNEFDDRGIPYMIGTDTSRHDVLSSARFSLLQNIQNTGGYERSIRCAAEALFKNAPSFASKRFNVPLGKLEPGAAADIVVFESHPNNAVNTEQMYKHFLFDLCGRDCITSIINGVTVMLDRELMLIDGDASDKDINTVISKLNT